MEAFSKEKVVSYVDTIFDTSVIKSLEDYIRIDNKSRQYDPEWNTNGKLQKAAQHIRDWILTLDIKGLKTQILQLNDQKGQKLAPVIFTIIDGQLDFDVLYYGHYDKQPQSSQWNQELGLGPYTPKIIDNKLYGRGGADDGYSTYSTMVSIKACQLQGIPLPRCVMITEGDQQSGDQVEYYIQKLKGQIGNPKIIFCLDSGTVDYKTFTLTNSLRGYLTAYLSVSLISQEIHSGQFSGLVSDSFRVAIQLIQRIQDTKTGQVVQDFQVKIPQKNIKYLHQLVALLGTQAIPQTPLLPGVTHMSTDPLQLLMNSGWKATLTVTGAQGLPPFETAANVLRTNTSFKLSVRLPPTLNNKEAETKITQILTHNPPYNAQVKVSQVGSGSGWTCPNYQPYLQNILKQAAQDFFDGRLAHISQGGSIPLMSLLSSIWPQAQFLITGVLGPKSNAHGPNEFIELNYCKKLTCAMASILANVAISK